MNRVVLTSKVSSDGTLRLAVPLGPAEADHEVRVTVESAARQKKMSTEEWGAWIDAMAGSWQGEFSRPPQGEFEDRESMS